MARPNSDATIARVVGALTDALGAYTQGSMETKTQLWDVHGTSLIGRLYTS